MAHQNPLKKAPRTIPRTIPLYGAVTFSESNDASVDLRSRRPVFAALCVPVLIFVGWFAVQRSNDYFLRTSLIKDATSNPQPYIYKRTYASIDAVADASFMNENLGLMIDASSIFKCSPGSPGFQRANEHDSPTSHSKEKNESSWAIEYCAQRYSVVSDLNPELHFFQSDVTPEGPIRTANWVQYWNDLHRNFDSTFRWHEFMAMALSAYTPDLTPFIKRWEGNKTPILRRVLNRTSDSSILYSARIVIPNTGHIIEIVADHVDDEFITTFVPYGSEECEPAHSLTQWTTEEMRFLWTMNSGNLPNKTTSMLPDIIMLQLTHPTTDPTELQVYLSSAIGSEIDIDVYEDSTINCSWADISLEPILWLQSSEQQGINGVTEKAGFREVPHFGKLNGPGGVKSGGIMGTKTTDNGFRFYVRMVHNRAADVGKYSVDDYSKYISQTVDLFTGSNKGYSRHLDSHIGLDISYDQSLDTVAENLDEMGASYHSAGDLITGSNWARGVNGLNVEFLGYYDNMKFKKFELTELDYCSQTGFSFPNKTEDATYCAGNWDKDSSKSSDE